LNDLLRYSNNSVSFKFIDALAMSKIQTLAAAAAVVLLKRRSCI